MVHSAHYGAGPVARRHGAGAGLRPGAMVLVHNGAGLRPSTMVRCMIPEMHHGTWCIDGAGTVHDDYCLAFLSSITNNLYFLAYTF